MLNLDNCGLNQFKAAVKPFDFILDRLQHIHMHQRVEISMHHGNFLVDRIQEIDAKLQVHHTRILLNQRVQEVKTVFQQVSDSVMLVEGTDKIIDLTYDFDLTYDNVIESIEAGFQGQQGVLVFSD